MDRKAGAEKDGGGGGWCGEDHGRSLGFPLVAPVFVSCDDEATGRVAMTPRDTRAHTHTRRHRAYSPQPACGPAWLSRSFFFHYLSVAISPTPVHSLPPPLRTWDRGGFRHPRHRLDAALRVLLPPPQLDFLFFPALFLFDWFSFLLGRTRHVRALLAPGAAPNASASAGRKRDKRGKRIGRHFSPFFRAKSPFSSLLSFE